MARFRIERIGTAYFLCSFVSTAVVGAAFLPFVVWNVTRQRQWGEFNFLIFIERCVSAWLLLGTLGLFVAAPFVFPATWLGARYRLESALYYAMHGGITVSVIAFLLVGLPRHTPFGDTITAWLVGPPCGTIWGLAWWYLHRRWIQPDRRAI